MSAPITEMTQLLPNIPSNDHRDEALIQLIATAKDIAERYLNAKNTYDGLYQFYNTCNNQNTLGHYRDSASIAFTKIKDLETVVAKLDQQRTSLLSNFDMYNGIYGTAFEKDNPQIASYHSYIQEINNCRRSLEDISYLKNRFSCYRRIQSDECACIIL